MRVILPLAAIIMAALFMASVWIPDHAPAAALPDPPEVHHATATPTATATPIPGPALRAWTAGVPSGLFRGPSPTPTAAIALVYAQPVYWPSWGNDPACLAHPDRYNWQPYATAAGFPAEAFAELAFVIRHESGGDLCAVNKSSGATCWIQQVPGGPDFLDPQLCMSYGYAKWIDGGRSFWRHWYQWWPAALRP